MEPTSKHGEDIETFFRHLAAEPQPLLRTVKGRMRFEALVDDDHERSWYVTISQGDVALSDEEQTAEPDAVVRLQAPLLAEIVAGRANAMASLLRGDIWVEGNPELVMQFQRTFPGPQASTK